MHAFLPPSAFHLPPSSLTPSTLPPEFLITPFAAHFLLPHQPHRRLPCPLKLSS